MWFGDEFKLPSRRHGSVSALRTAALRSRSSDRAALSKQDAIEIVHELARDAQRGERAELAALHEGIVGLALEGVDRLSTAAIVDRLLDAVDRGRLVFVANTGARRADGEATQRPARQTAREQQDPLLRALTKGAERIPLEGSEYRIVRARGWSGSADEDVVRLLDARRLMQRMTLALARSIDEQMAWEEALALLADSTDHQAKPGALLLLRKRSGGGGASEPPAPPPPPPPRRAPPPKPEPEDDRIDWVIWVELDPDDPKASDDELILIDERESEVQRVNVGSCAKDGFGVKVVFERVDKHAVYTLIRDYGPNEGGGADTLFIGRSPHELDEEAKAS